MAVLYADTRLGGVTQWVYGDPEEAMGIPRELLDSVCYICTKVQGQWQYGGTGFFLSLPSLRSRYTHLYVVTARHCLDEIAKIGGQVYLRINARGGGAHFFQIRAKWFYPESASCDLAILPLDLEPNSGLQFATISAGDLIRANDSFSLRDYGPGDEVLITGLFSMRHGTQQNYPIVRSGILSAMPDEPMVDEHGTYDAFLIEARSTGGLSGSPVFLVYRPPGPREKRGSRDAPMMMPQTYFLLGIIRGHWDTQRTSLIPAFDNTEVNLGIAVVTPAIEIHRLLSSEELLKDQREKEDDYNAENAPTPD